MVASGPSLTLEAAATVRRARLAGWHAIVVNDAYRAVRYAEVLYAADRHWWEAHGGVADFHGERWSCTSSTSPNCDDKTAWADTYYSINLVEARDGQGFAAQRGIHLGACSHSGFHAVNLALVFGAERVVLIGFDMRRVDGASHFFGEHPPELRRYSGELEARAYRDFIRSYPPDARVVNATPGSALKAYEFVDLETELLGNRRVHRNGTELNPHAG